MSNQHAREWITPEMTRRLMHYYLDNYGKDKRIKKIVDSTELWFVLSANPDGYDYTFADAANRLWRKNLRDVNGDGADHRRRRRRPQPQLRLQVGLRRRGLVPDPTSETYRGAGPGSEPETKALDAFEKRIGFEYGINYHSAAELLLYGVGWQVATPDARTTSLYKSLAGTPENSAVPGYHPQVSSELYTTNGEADGHAANVNGMAMFTPEMSTCQTASDIDPNDAWKAGRLRRPVFTFPDDEKLIQQEFAKNIPFALSVAETAAHPDKPSSSVGIDAARLHPGDLHHVVLPRRRPGGLRRRPQVRARQGAQVPGQRRPYRGRGAQGLEGRRDLRRRGQPLLRRVPRQGRSDGEPGDKVEVWFTGETKSGKQTSSEHFTYTVAERPKARHPRGRRGGRDRRRRPQTYVDALKANGRKALVWDVATQGAPDALGVLEPLQDRRPLHGRGRPGRRHPARSCAPTSTRAAS